MKPTGAYRAAALSSMTPRRADAEALHRAAQTLRNAKDDPSRLDEAIRFNRLLWSILITDVTDPKNPLPEPIKINLLRLGEFVVRTLTMLPADPSPVRLDSIADINIHLALGLMSVPAPNHAL